MSNPGFFLIFRCMGIARLARAFLSFDPLPIYLKQTARKAPSHGVAAKSGETAKGEAVSSTGRCDPQRAVGPTCTLARPWDPPCRGLPASPEPLGLRSGEPWRCAPWHCNPGYDQRRAPYDHPDFYSNAFNDNLFTGSLAFVALPALMLIAAWAEPTAARAAMKMSGFFMDSPELIKSETEGGKYWRSDQ